MNINTQVNNDHTEKLKLIAALLLLFTSISYIVSIAYLPINGSHTWRQADVYAHILGFMEYKNFQPLDLFVEGRQRIFDIPIYQFLIANISFFLNQEPLAVTRFFNTFLWSLSAIFGFKIVKYLSGDLGSIFFLFFFCTSPLLLHYFSTPLPDVLALTLCVVGLYLLFISNAQWKLFLFGTMLVSTASIIKSPIPFIFILFYLIYVSASKLLNYKSCADTIKTVQVITLISLSLIVAISAEAIRGEIMNNNEDLIFAQNPKWYFGNLELRWSPEFWSRIKSHIIDMHGFSLIYIYFPAIIISLALNFGKNISVSTAAIVASLAGILIFSNLYKIHNYYLLPATIILFISLSFSLDSIHKHFISKTHHKQLLKSLTYIVIIIATIYSTAKHDRLSNRIDAIQYSHLSHYFEDIEIFIFIDNKDAYPNPTIGGLTKTKFRRISSQTLNNECEDYISNYNAFITEYDVECLNSKTNKFNYYVNGNKYKIYIRF